MSNREYESRIITLADIVDKDIIFNIPIYQRLYVWKQAQINTLLEDLYNAFIDNEKQYFLGGIMTVRNSDANTKCLYDLVDGQQRFTTLWMICNILKFIVDDKATERLLSYFCEKDGNKRIHFSIRPEITEFITNLDIRSISNESDIPDIKNMISAIGDIRSFLETSERRGNISEFAQYILNKVYLINTEIPQNADLNKIFELINGRGQQLSQTDILKSRILDQIRVFLNGNEDRLTRLGQIWDSCSDMSGYIESNLYYQDPRLTWKDMLIAKHDDTENYYDFDEGFLENFINEPVKSNYGNTGDSANLLNIIESSGQDLSDNSPESRHRETVRSIVSFPMLLLYTLRIFLIKKKIDIYNCGRYDIDFFNEKKLLLIFSPFINYLTEDSNKSDAIKFIHLLWKVRYVFDKHVVKFVSTDDCREPALAIKKLRIYFNNSNGSLSVNRDKSEKINDMSQLQSMLYFSQPRVYEHWVCPFIHRALTEDDSTTLLKFLQELDNHLLCRHHDVDMLVRTYHVMADGLKAGNSEDYYSYFKTKISESRGCGFAHYLFYKLEYMLWKTEDEDRKERWQNYRITSKNSIEHISPQKPKFDVEKISNCDDFGNLALISCQENSSYNNKSYREKMEAYKAKREHGFIDSLKSDLIYEHYAIWGEEQCETHFRKILKTAEQYFKRTSAEYAAIESPENKLKVWLKKNYESNRTKLLQVVAMEDVTPNGWRLLSLEELLDMAEVRKIFSENAQLSSDRYKGKEDFKYLFNYYMYKYPHAIEYCTESRYKTKFHENGIENIILIDGSREGKYNFQELLMVIVSSHLENKGIGTTQATWYDKDNECSNDFRRIPLFLQSGRITDTIKTENDYETLYLDIWFDYDNCTMNYQLDYSELEHRIVFRRKIQRYGWIRNKSGFLYLDGLPVLHSFNRKSDYERIADKSSRELIKVIKNLRSIVL